MRTLLKWLNSSFSLSALLIIGVILNFVAIGRLYDLSKSDWAAWVGAIGTVATLVMTIWLATDASRTKRSEQLNLALITAAQFNVRLRNVVRALANARTDLEKSPFDQPDDPRLMFGEGYRRFDDSDLWTAEELVPLIYLPNQLAARLAWIGINVRSTQVIFKKLSEEAEPISFDVMGLLTRNTVYEVKESLAEIQRVMVELTEFQLKHGLDFAVPRYNPEYEIERS